MVLESLFLCCMEINVLKKIPIDGYLIIFLDSPNLKVLYLGNIHKYVRIFLVIFDPPSPNVQFLPSNVRFFWVILDPPPPIGHH